MAAFTPCFCAVIQICDTNGRARLVLGGGGGPGGVAANANAEDAYRLPPPPAVVELLAAPQSEGGVEHGVVHGISHDAVRLGVEALRERSDGKRRLRPSVLPQR